MRLYVVVFLWCVLLVPNANSQNRQTWSQTDCQEMSAACAPLPKGAKGPPGSRGFPGDKGLTGLPGIPGPPGPRGPPGRGSSPQALGMSQPRRGETGEPGFPGQPGDLGEPGIPGLPGSAGFPGFPGVKGNKGQEGDAGRQGKRGTPGVGSSNARECTWRIDYTRGTGMLTECTITKRTRSSAIHVVYEGPLEIGLCKRCCKRWYFTFNGQECRQPAAIDAIMSGGLRTDYPHNYYGRVDGMCEVPYPAGNLRVALNIQNCKGFSSNRDPIKIALYRPNGRILVREIVPSQ